MSGQKFLFGRLSNSAGRNSIGVRIGRNSNWNSTNFFLVEIAIGISTRIILVELPILKFQLEFLSVLMYSDFYFIIQ